MAFSGKTAFQEQPQGGIATARAEKLWRHGLIVGGRAANDLKWKSSN
jgi:hypothetical protein